jgi:hypothetical protein
MIKNFKDFNFLSFYVKNDFIKQTRSYFTRTLQIYFNLFNLYLLYLLYLNDYFLFIINFLFFKQDNLQFLKQYFVYLFIYSIFNY